MTNEISSEDVVAEETDLTPESFSFFDVLEGITYPKDAVNVYLDEAALYQRAKLLIEMADLPEGGDMTPLIERMDKLEERIQKSRYVFHITGVADDVVTDLKDVADAHFAKKYKQFKAADGTLRKRLPEEESVAYSRYFTALIMSVHVEQIEAPNGAILTAPGVDELAHFMDRAPTMEKAKLNDAIGELRVSSSAYEASIDADFLAKP